MSILKKIFGSKESAETPRGTVAESAIVDITVLLGFPESSTEDYSELAKKLYRSWNPSWSGANDIEATAIQGSKDEIMNWITSDYAESDLYKKGQDLQVYAQVARTNEGEHGVFWLALITAVSSPGQGRKISLLDKRPLEFSLE